MNTAIGSSDRQPSAEDAALARIVRREAGLIVAQLQRRLGNFDVAEEAVQEAILVALRTWRRDGVPAMQAQHGFTEKLHSSRAGDPRLTRKRREHIAAGVNFSARKDGSSGTDTSYQRPDSARLSQRECARAH